MGKGCVVPNCGSGVTPGSDLVALFKAPSSPDRLLKWQSAIPGLGRVITDSDLVCEKHFKREDINEEADTKDQNEDNIKKVEFVRKQLVKGAVPSIFPSCSLCDESLSKYKPSRKRHAERSQSLRRGKRILSQRKTDSDDDDDYQNTTKSIFEGNGTYYRRRRSQRQIQMQSKASSSQVTCDNCDQADDSYNSDCPLIDVLERIRTSQSNKLQKPGKDILHDTSKMKTDHHSPVRQQENASSQTTIVGIDQEKLVENTNLSDTEFLETTLLRLHIEKLLLEVAKLTEERERISIEKRNITLRSDIIQLRQKLSKCTGIPYPDIVKHPTQIVVVVSGKELNAAGKSLDTNDLIIKAQQISQKTPVIENVETSNSQVDKETQTGGKFISSSVLQQAVEQSCNTMNSNGFHDPATLQNMIVSSLVEQTNGSNSLHVPTAVTSIPVQTYVDQSEMETNVDISASLASISVTSESSLQVSAAHPNIPVSALMSQAPTGSHIPIAIPNMLVSSIMDQAKTDNGLHVSQAVANMTVPSYVDQSNGGTAITIPTALPDMTMSPLMDQAKAGNINYVPVISVVQLGAKSNRPILPKGSVHIDGVSAADLSGCVESPYACTVVNSSVPASMISDTSGTLAYYAL